jgi:hypothetical protein
LRKLRFVVVPADARGLSKPIIALRRKCEWPAKAAIWRGAIASSY